MSFKVWLDNFRTNRLRKICSKRGNIYYGDGGTIHTTNELDVEVCNGKVVAVWFRCSTLPFTVHSVDERREKEMVNRYSDKFYPVPKIHGIELEGIY